MDCIRNYFPDLTNKQLNDFDKLAQLYHYWNDRINVISRKDIQFLNERHILHSLAIAKIISFKPNTTILDVGTGGGLPGIPLAIVFPECQFTLLDSIEKKIKVVDSIIAELGLKNVKTKNMRVENLQEKYDFIVSRAFSNFPDFYRFTSKNCKKTNHNQPKNGIIYLKGGDFSEELKNFPKTELYNINQFFKEEFFETKKVIYLPI